MASRRVFAQESWRRTGFINFILGITCGIVLLICFVISIKQPGSSLYTSTIIFEGKCNNTSNLNIVLHLVLNLLSTGILASSNFFMQVLNSPSREEVNKAHAFFQSVDIGMPSIRNIHFVSYFKKTSWFILFLSSLPIHLFFNSSVFETNFQGQHWHLTIGTEAFTQGADFFAPGASLAPAGSPHPAYQYDTSLGYYVPPPGRWNRASTVMRYGQSVPLEQYEHKTSMIRQNITKTAANAGSWVQLDASACHDEYALCNPRSKYGDVMIVVETGTDDAEGWARQEVFNLTSDLSSQWEPYVPSNQTNSLWYSTQCKTKGIHEVEKNCFFSCGSSAGVSNLQPSLDADSSTWTINFQNISQIGYTLYQATSFGYNNRFDKLSVKYCLAQPQPSGCKIGVSNLLLMVVIVCIFTKVTQCGLILWKLQDHPLVTLGDAMESFITKPDPQTTGLATLDVVDAYQIETRPRRDWSPEEDSLLTPSLKPRSWQPSNRRLLSVIPRVMWTRTYTLLLISMAILSVGMVMSYQSNGNSFRGPFGRSDEIRRASIQNEGYLSALLTANVPQLLLSLCYFSCNAFFTRLRIEREWNSYSLKFQPLRVSYPAGEQVSSYRLQLPYKYGIPLLAISILCHWLLSNAFFLFVIEGGYWLAQTTPGTSAFFHVSEQSLVSLGYSPPALMALFVVICVLIPLPFLFSLPKLEGKMVAGGSSSLVLSAACHSYVSRIVGPLDNSSTENISNKPGEDRSLSTAEDLEEWERRLRELSRSKLKWGAMPLPDHLAEAVNDEGEKEIMHLGFGGESSSVVSPTGGWYL